VGECRDGSPRDKNGKCPNDLCPDGTVPDPIWGCNRPSLCPEGTRENLYLKLLGLQWPLYCVPIIDIQYKTCADGSSAKDHPNNTCPEDVVPDPATQCWDGSYPADNPDGKCPPRETGKCRPDEVQDGDTCYGTCPDNSTYTRGVDGDYPCSERGGDGDEYDPDKGGEQPQCGMGEYFDLTLNRCVPFQGVTICFDDAGRPRPATYMEYLYGCMGKDSEEGKASGGIVKKTKKYQMGGIASLPARDPRMGGAMNPADGYNFGFAEGGMAAMPEYQAGGKLLRGPGDGMSDDIPAVIRGKGVQRAALADGEFVIPADVVSHLGNGSTEAGAKKLYKMMEQIRRARTGTGKQAPQVNPDKFLPRVTPAKKRRRG
jgi:hypothetical protein